MAKKGKKAQTPAIENEINAIANNATTETAPTETTGDLTLAGNPMIHTAEIIAIIGRDLAERDSDAKATGTKRDAALTLPERQAIKQAKRRLTLATTKAAMAATETPTTTN